LALTREGKAAEHGKAITTLGEKRGKRKDSMQLLVSGRAGSEGEKLHPAERPDKETLVLRPNRDSRK